MFALFYSLYYSLFKGSWTLYTFTEITLTTKTILNGLGTFLTSIFNDNANTYDTLGETIVGSTFNNIPNILSLCALILALITSIGIVVMAVKGVKKAFGIFFGHIR